MIKISNLNYSYNNNLIIKDFSLNVKRWEIISIIGTSWIWKTTLLNIIAWFNTNYAWNIYIEWYHHLWKKIILINQENDLFDWLTVWNNIKIIHDKITDKEVLEYLKIINLDEYINYYPSQLSWWMKKKLSLIRWISVKPNLVLLDEPFSSLDILTKHNLYNECFNIIKSHNITCLIVTHDIDEAIKLSDKILIFNTNTLLNKWTNNFNKDFIINNLKND